MSSAAAAPAVTVKVLLLGDPFVGKTSLRSQFIHHVFSNSYRATVGADYLSTKVTLSSGGQNSHKEGDNGSEESEDLQVLLQIWDTAGQERFNSLVKNFYRGTDVAIFVYDVSNPSSFHNLAKWIKQFIDNVRVSRPAILIVGNKCDKPIGEHLISIRQCRDLISSSENYIDQYIHDIDQDVFHMSAKNYQKVEKLFQRAAYLGNMNLEDNENTMMTFDRVDISEPLENRGRKGYCC